MFRSSQAFPIDQMKLSLTLDHKKMYLLSSKFFLKYTWESYTKKADKLGDSRKQTSPKTIFPKREPSHTPKENLKDP